MTYLESLQEARRARLQRLGCLPVSSRVQPVPFTVVPVPVVEIAPVENTPEPVEVIPEKPIVSRVTVRQIIDLVCPRYCVTPIDLVSHRRSQKVCLPRQVVMWLARHLTTLSMPAIGRLLGDRDHTTILSGIRKIDALRETDIQLQATLDDLHRELTGVLP
jgi:hypothetical protein